MVERVTAEAVVDETTGETVTVTGTTHEEVEAQLEAILSDEGEQVEDPNPS